MDEATKQTFKGRFMILTVMLNIIILCFAMAAFVLFRFAPEGTPGLVIGILLLAVGAVFSLSFRKHYTLTKAWLHEQP
jgi:ACR3 family arsenite efflux pump ArsB